MNSHTTKSFRDALKRLSAEARKQAREAYVQFQVDPFSPGLNFEEVNSQKHIWSARITRGIRVLGFRDRDEIIPDLSGWEERVVGIHEGTEVGEARGEMW